MRKKYFKMVVFVLLVTGMGISLYLGVPKKANWERLMKENVEALTNPEDNPYYPCVKAMGFCFIHGIEKDGIAIID